MKKVTMFLLAVLLIASLFVSCDTNTNAVLDEHVSVSFSTGSDGRSLGYEIENITNLKWHYSATKTNPNDAFKFGETDDTTIIDWTKKIELSQGKWNFTLWANKVVDESGTEGAKVYEGSVTGVLITDETSPKTIVINVSPEVAGESGSMVLQNITVSLRDGSSTTVYPQVAIIEGVEGGELTLTNGCSAEKTGLQAGDYSVTVKYTEVIDGTTVTYASETIVVTVWSGRTTTIKGNLSEITGSAILDKKIIQTDITQENSVIVGEDTKFALVGLAPSNNTESSEVNDTVVTFPAGTLSGANAKLQVKVNSIDSDFSFSASDTSSTVGSISLKLNDQESSSFTENVTITTYIAKGLSGVQVKYDGDPQEEITIANYNTDSEWTNAGTTEGYSKESGKLVFTTNHFSEYFVVADEVVAYNATTSTAYNDLNDAIEATDSGEVVKLIANYEIPQDVRTIEIGEKKNLTLDLNGFILSAAIRPDNDAKHFYAIDNYGILVIQDSSDSQEGKIESRGIENLENGKLTINSGSFYSIDSNGGAAVWNEADVTINGGSFYTIYEGKPSDYSGPGCLNNQGTALITSGRFSSVNKRTYSIVSTGFIEIKPKEENGVIVQGAHGGLGIDGGTGVIEGGNFSSTDYYGLYVSNDGVGTDPTKATVTVKGGNYDGPNYSVLIGSDINNPVNSTIEILGGTYKKPLIAQKVSLEGAIVIKGGVFAFDPNKYLASGYSAIKNENNEWVVFENTIQTTQFISCCLFS